MFNVFTEDGFRIDIVFREAVKIAADRVVDLLTCQPPAVIVLREIKILYI